MFPEGPWRLHRCATELDSLRAFKLAARMGASCYALLRVRHRHLPFRTFYIANDPSVAEVFKHCPECTLDEYSAKFRSHYQDGCAGPVAQAELLALAAILETGTASTERSHSSNESRNKLKVQTHSQELAELSACNAGRSCAESRRGVANRNMKRRRTAASFAVAVADADGRSATTVPTRRWSWTWRAFINVQAKGRWMSDEVVAELSAN